eukprot:6212518-Pleurochrysis_carterae.AAC.10
MGVHLRDHRRMGECPRCCGMHVGHGGVSRILACSRAAETETAWRRAKLPVPSSVNAPLNVLSLLGPYARLLGLLMARRSAVPPPPEEAWDSEDDDEEKFRKEAAANENE